MATLVPLSAIDADMIEQLLDAAFGENRHARTAYRIREGTAWLDALSFAALDEEEYLVGSIQLWPVALTDPQGRPHPLIMVGPVAVMPGRQGEGFGKALMAASLGAIDAAFDEGAPPFPQILIGDPEYYGQWGFTAEHTGSWHCPGPFERERLLLRTGNPAILPPEGMLGPWTSETSQAAKD
ncbi:GNAT family N-acetyltransferase [Qipengyuania gelatinilytica]|uniref:N-acetyltransferase n=1 Tax=Qipengyuania gelatinilytica TaxID=2867231 RepID=A0ABX9A3Z1_9SPHN|nr:N-acetyltransferase [Qipengyuania gelatinilytica]QZD95990.1 N-acetyltransferase [Qipengyuania gelatinilytica]